MNRIIDVKQGVCTSVLLAVSLVLASCSSAASVEDATNADLNDVEATTTTAVAESTETETTLAEAASDSTEQPDLEEPVELIDSGEEPRIELRLQPTAGESQLLISQTQLLSQTVDGDVTDTGPAQTIESVTNITVTLEEDLFRVSSRIDSMQPAADTDPALAAELEQTFAPNIGLTTEAVLNSRGIAVSSQAGSETITQAANPFPEEAVGVGAVWETTQIIDLGGLEVEQITTTTVTDISGNIVTTDVEAVQNLESGTTGLLNGIPATVQLWDSLTTGTVVLDLTQISPVTSTVSTNAAQVLEIGGSTLDQTTQVEITITGG